MVRVRLTKKPAHILTGIDVTNARVGDVLHLSHSAAHVMIGERRAEPLRDVRDDRVPAAKTRLPKSVG